MSELPENSSTPTAILLFNAQTTQNQSLPAFEKVDLSSTEMLGAVCVRNTGLKLPRGALLKINTL